MILDVLNGTWKPVAYEEQGQPRAPEEIRPMAELVVAGDKFAVRHGKLVLGASRVLAAGVVCFDLSTFPNRVDFIQVYDGQTVGEPQLGIFQADGDRLIICLAGSGASRPTAFETSPGSDHGLTVWQRVLI